MKRKNNGSPHTPRPASVRSYQVCTKKGLQRHLRSDGGTSPWGRLKRMSWWARNGRVKAPCSGNCAACLEFVPVGIETEKMAAPA
jgi:hypothetical protein